MNDLNDLELLIQSATPVVVVESNEEKRIVALCKELTARTGKDLYKWSVTNGLRRMGPGFRAQKFNTDPTDVLQHIKGSGTPGIYLMLDFHPYLENPLNIRLIREIAQNRRAGSILIFLSPSFTIPGELTGLTAKFSLSLPSQEKIMGIVKQVATEYTLEQGKKVVADKKAVKLLCRNMMGLTASDVERLARNAIYDDGAISQSDIRRVMEAKYELINQDGVLSFEYETEEFAGVGGLKNLKQWLEMRRAVFHGGGREYGLEAPKGVLLLGVQGCGKSLAAKAVAGVWGVPLLRLDFGALYNKYIGETERNLRKSLETAEVMSPCVLWIDEIEKGLSGGSGDDGVSMRVLGTLLTWMAEKAKPVFMVATANDVTALPPELLRKGRFDELFFVDLPKADSRMEIFRIQLSRRRLNPGAFDLTKLAEHSEGFSGSEIEQAVVAGLYATVASGQPIDTEQIIVELERTRPLSVLMAEKIQGLRHWAAQRTVLAG